MIRTLLSAGAASLILATGAFAQSSTSTAQADAAQQAAAAGAQQDDPDRDVNLAQPDFYLAALPTTLRLPRFGS